MLGVTPDEASEKAADSAENAGDPEAGEPDANDPDANDPDANESDANDPDVTGDTSAADDSATASNAAPSDETEEPASASDQDSVPAEPAGVGNSDDELTDEEWQERLEAEQEKITKENRRIMDERRDRLATAQQRVRELNARFADWYYVIPEETFSQLRIKRDELLKSGAGENGPLNVAPKFDFPGL